MPHKSETARMARERALRMLALQILQQLPDDQQEAQRVLAMARQELDEFVHAEEAPRSAQLRIV